MKRSVFFVSDGTGITAETLGQALLTQFETLTYQAHTFPFIDTTEKLVAVVNAIDTAAAEDHARPLVFATFSNPLLLEMLNCSEALIMDLFSTYLKPLADELGMLTRPVTGHTHGMTDQSRYDIRMASVNFTLAHDDGASTRHYGEADVILLGISRTGKTPTSLYLAMRFGVKAANYPLTEEDLQSLSVPQAIQAFLDRVHGLTIDPDRLHQIRQQRHPDSQYSSLAQCHWEAQRAEQLYRLERIPVLSTTNVSIEEIAVKIMHELGITRRVR